MKNKPILRTILIIFAVLVLLFGIFLSMVGAELFADTVKTVGGSHYSALQQKTHNVFRRLLSDKGADTEAGTDEAYGQALSQEISQMASDQEEIDSLLLNELQSGNYSLDDPFVMVDPYGTSPMSAVLLFKTEEPVRVSVEIVGDTGLSTVKYDFENYEKEHALPLYGLYAGRDNTVNISTYSKGGKTEKTTLTVTTDILPEDIGHEVIRANVLDAKKYQEGFTFTWKGNLGEYYKAAFDSEGAPRWYLDLRQYPALATEQTQPCDYNGGKSVFVSYGNYHHGDIFILEFNFLGKLMNAYTAPYGAHHDLFLADDMIYLTGTTDDGQESLIYGIDRSDGTISYSLDLSTVLQPKRNQLAGKESIVEKLPDGYHDTYYKASDWCHMNTLEERSDGTFLLSCRNQSTVLCMDKEGGIKWMLCDPTGYYEYFKQYILTPVGDNFLYPDVQHHANELPDQDGDPDTIDILMFDNGALREERVSRMIQYRIDPEEMTVETVWVYGDDRPEIFSLLCGSAYLLDNGNRLGCFEADNDYVLGSVAYCVEVAEDGEAVWECWRTGDDGANNCGAYRMERLNIYASTANDLHLGQKANLFLGKQK